MTEILTVPDGHIAYADDGDGPAVVLLHGGALDHRMWDAQVAVLTAAGHRAIRPDARGHGASSTPTAPFRHCDDVAALIGHLDCAPAVLVGLSMGARTAVDAALEHPQLVARVVVSGAGLGEPQWSDPWILGIQAEWAQAQREADGQRWIDAFVRVAAGPQRGLDELDPGMLAYLRDAAGHTLAAHVTPDAVPPAEVPAGSERLAEIEVPVRAIDGALDSVDHLTATRRLVEGVADGAATTIAAAAHYPNLERPREYGDALLSFGIADRAT